MSEEKENLDLINSPMDNYAVMAKKNENLEKLVKEFNLEITL